MINLNRFMKLVGGISGIGLMGYWYLKTHPDMIYQMKRAMKETSRMIYNQIDCDD